MPQPSIRRSPVLGLRLVVGVAVSIATAGLGSGRIAVAEVEPVALIWNAPPTCPNAQTVHDQVERSLGASPKELASVAAVVNVLQASDGLWRASLVVHSHGKGAERRFEAESCPALASAAALIIALAAEGADEPAPVPAAPERRVPEGRDGLSIAAGPSAATPAPGWNPSGPSFLVGVLIDGHTMPSEPAIGVEVAAGQSWNASLWRLRLLGTGTFFLPEDLPQANFGFPSGDYWMLSFGGRGCLTAVLSRWEVGSCLGGELAVMRGTNIGQTPAHSTQYWASPLGSAVVAVTILPDVVVFARADVVIPSTRRSFAADGGGEIYKVPAVAARGAVGIELRFF
jgi:hypothetical protein